MMGHWKSEFVRHRLEKQARLRAKREQWVKDHPAYDTKYQRAYREKQKKKKL